MIVAVGLCLLLGFTRDIVGGTGIGQTAHLRMSTLGSIAPLDSPKVSVTTMMSKASHDSTSNQSPKSAQVGGIASEPFFDQNFELRYSHRSVLGQMRNSHHNDNHDGYHDGSMQLTLVPQHMSTTRPYKDNDESRSIWDRKFVGCKLRNWLIAIGCAIFLCLLCFNPITCLFKCFSCVAGNKSSGGSKNPTGQAALDSMIESSTSASAEDIGNNHSDMTSAVAIVESGVAAPTAPTMREGRITNGNATSGGKGHDLKL